VSKDKPKDKLKDKPNDSVAKGLAGARPEPATAAEKSPPSELVKTATQKPAAKKPDPTRFGDWEKNGRCIDF
jgi:hypothetical protein